MRVLVVGATGAVGRPLSPRLVEAGHEVIATARRTPKESASGVSYRSLDLLDGAAVAALVKAAAPDAIIHQATALAGLGNNLRRFDKAFATTIRLRTEGTRSLIDATVALPTPPRLVVQSFCGWPWAPDGGPVKTEQDRLDPDPAPAFRRTFAALVEQESLVTAYPQGIALRYGALYGPGTSLALGGDQIEAIRKRRFPLVGDAGAVWSFLHVEDAADAAVAALTQGDGIYNVVDDTPVRLGEWLVDVAEALGAPAPRRVPVWLARMAGGDGLVHMMTRARGSSNAKARAELGWTPRHPDWRSGFTTDRPGRCRVSIPLAGSARLREATAADAERVASLHALSQRVTYAPYLPAGVAESIDTESKLGQWRGRLDAVADSSVLVAEGDRGSSSDSACWPGRSALVDGERPARASGPAWSRNRT